MGCENQKVGDDAAEAGTDDSESKMDRDQIAEHEMEEGRGYLAVHGFQREAYVNHEDAVEVNETEDVESWDV